MHKAEKHYKCNECGVQFRHNNSLVRHLFQHTGERPYGCQNCDTSFTQLNRLKEHIKRHHQKNKSSSPFVSNCSVKTVVSYSTSHANPASIPIVTSLKNPSETQNRLKPRPSNASRYQYKPIAPAPINKTLNQKLHSQTIQSPPSATIILPATVNQQPSSYFTQAANGAMYLITNPTPSINSQSPPMLVSNQNGVLQLIQQPQSQPSFVIGNHQNMAGYLHTPILSPMIAQQVPVVQMNTLIANPSPLLIPNYCSPSLPHIIQTNQEKQTTFQNHSKSTSEHEHSQSPICKEKQNLSENTQSVSITDKNDKISQELLIPHSDVKQNNASISRSILSVDNKETGITDQKITFESGSFSENTVSYQNEKGQTVKLDILERAILEIPDLSK